MSPQQDTAPAPAGKAGGGYDPAPTTDWRDMLGYIRPQRAAITVGLVLTLLASLAAMLQPLAAKLTIDALEEGASLRGPLVMVTVLVLSAASLSALGHYLLMRTAVGVVRQSRRRMVRRVLALGVPSVARFRPGDLLARVTTDSKLVRGLVNQVLTQTLNGSIVLVGVLILMAVLDLVLLLTTLATVSVIVVLIAIMMPSLQRASRGEKEGLSDLSSAVERSLGAFRTVKAATAEPTEAAAAERATEDAWRHGVRLGLLESIAAVMASVVLQGAFLLVLGVGGARVASGAIPLGTLIAFLLYIIYLVPPVLELVDGVTKYNVTLASMRRIREVMSLEPETGDDVEPAEQTPASLRRQAQGSDPVVPAGVSFRDVRFSYPEDANRVVHDGLTFDAPAGRITAVVGPSGAGKSTIFLLIERFYSPDAGGVLVDGRDVQDWPLDELRAMIGYVEQDAPVLEGTLRDNLTLGFPSIDDDEIARVLERTRLTDLVGKLPHGLDTQVGHRGNRLSGGERQRVAIARALLRRPRLLLLDEVTSQLDAVNEIRLQEVISEVGRECTVVVVAHRLSTVVRADQIVVVDGGRVRAVGTHGELVKQDALYQELAATQLLMSDDEVPAADLSEGDAGGVPVDTEQPSR